MNKEIKALIEVIGDDYERWSRRSFEANGYNMDRFDDKIEDFRLAIEIKEGSKYIKILTDSSVWGFINKGNKDFKVGDILRAKNYNAPSLNKPRGNIFDDTYDIAWTGPKYLPGSTGHRGLELRKERV